MMILGFNVLSGHDGELSKLSQDETNIGESYRSHTKISARTVESSFSIFPPQIRRGDIFFDYCHGCSIFVPK